LSPLIHRSSKWCAKLARALFAKFLFRLPRFLFASAERGPDPLCLPERLSCVAAKQPPQHGQNLPAKQQQDEKNDDDESDDAHSSIVAPGRQLYRNLVRDIAGPALLTDRHIYFVPLLLRRAVRIFL